MTPGELRERLDAIQTEVFSWDPSATQAWSRDSVDDAVEAWAAINRLIDDLGVLRRAAGIALARQLPDEYRSPAGTVVHRTVPKVEAWDGHSVLERLSEPVITVDGEKLPAVRLDVARRVIPACGQGATSSRWKLGELRKVLPEADVYRQVTWGDPIIAAGPLAYQARRTKPPEPERDDHQTMTEPTGSPTGTGV